MRILECAHSGKGKLPETWRGKKKKSTGLRKKAKRMWVVQVGNGEEGVKNLFVLGRSKKMEVAAADSLIICFIEVSWSWEEKGAHCTFRGVGGSEGGSCSRMVPGCEKAAPCTPPLPPEMSGSRARGSCKPGLARAPPERLGAFKSSSAG